jgi:hypothetical protein
MVIVAMVAGLVVAIGTITAGLRFVMTSSYSRGRRDEKEDAERARMAADLKELRGRMGLPGFDRQD